MTQPTSKMREISFKFYDKKTNKLLEECSMWWNYIEFLNQEDVIVCQFTGLKDKNGKEIYEGDIVKHTYYGVKNPKVSRVIFNIPNHRYGVDGWEGVDNETYYSLPFYLTPLNAKKMEVIGNIYENPELLTTNHHDK